jgi:hypothetical protein
MCRSDMNPLKYYKRNNYEFAVIKRVRSVALAIGRKGDSERYEVVYITDNEELALLHYTYSTESQAIEKFNSCAKLKTD